MKKWFFVLFFQAFTYPSLKGNSPLIEDPVEDPYLAFLKDFWHDSHEQEEKENRSIQNTKDLKHQSENMQDRFELVKIYGGLATKRAFRNVFDAIMERAQGPKGYFYKAIPRKYTEAFAKSQADNRPFGSDRMPPILYQKGEMPGLPGIVIDIDVARNVFLGILPCEGAMNAFLKQIEPNKNVIPEVSIIGMITDFELAFARGSDLTFFEIRNKLSKEIGAQVGDPLNNKVFDKLAFDKQVRITWTVFPAKDRRHVNAKQLLGAANLVVKNLNEGLSIYIHCKSGQGRSATAVVLSRSFLVIDQIKSLAAFEELPLLKKKNIIDYIRKKETNSMVLGRPEAKISPAKKVEIRQLMYERANIIAKNTDPAPGRLIRSTSPK